MKFCTECRTQLKENEVFCTECGIKQTEAKPAVRPVEPQEKRVQRTELKKPMSKKKKWFFGTVTTVVVLLVGAHLFLSSYLDPLKSFQAMDQAIVANDVEEFLSYIDFDDSALLDKEAYFNYIRDEEWESIKEQYIDILEQEQENNLQLSHIVYSDNGERLFNVKQESQLMLYKSHAFHAVPTKLVVAANVENAEIIINDSTMTLENTEPAEIAQIYPGEYVMQAQAENMFGSFTEELEFGIAPGEQRDIMLEFEGSSYSFNTDQENATLFVNGEDTGKIFREIDEIGPIPADVEIELHGEWKNVDGEVIKTDVFTLDDMGWYGFEFFFDIDTAEIEEEDEEEAEIVFGSEDDEADTDSIGDIVLNFRDAYEMALNNKDFSQIEPYLYGDSVVYNELKEYIDDLEDEGYHYDFQTNDILKVEEPEPQTYVVTTNETFVFTNHRGEMIDYDRTKEYILNFYMDSFRISNIEYVETNRDY